MDKNKEESEFDKFDKAMSKLIRVSPAEIKSKLDAEKLKKSSSGQRKAKNDKRSQNAD